MLKKIENYIRAHHLPAAPARLIVALSGGADSVALLLILRELGYAPIAAHCNFHLRGAESDRDEHFVRTLCDRLEVPLQVVHFDTTGFARQENISIEMAARQLRYEWFEKVREEQRAAAIAVAHHSDDNAETLLLNLVRGTGLHGLKGMRPQNGNIIRPLLGVQRKDLENYLSARHQDFVTDSTNLETVYKRNKIRHEVLPLLRVLNPSIDVSLSETAQRLAEAETLYNYAVAEWKKKVAEPLADGIRIHLDALLQSPAPDTLLHELLTPYCFSPSEIGMMAQNLNRPTGKTFASATHMAVLHRGNLEVRRRPVKISPTTLPDEGEILLPNGGRITLKRMRRSELTAIPKCADKIAVDADSLVLPLTIRSIGEGDRFQPYGMKGTKLVSDYLTDRHRSLIDKLAATVLCDNRGIVWLVNERVAQTAAVTDQTQEIILIEFRSEKTQSKDTFS